MKFKIFICITTLFFSGIINASPEFSKGPGLLFLVGSSAKFSETDKSVQISKFNENNNKLVIYAHGGAGFTESDKQRVLLFKEMGFDTISFDAFSINNLDGAWVNRNLTDRAKQDLIINVMIGAIDFSLDQKAYTDIVFYGQSNGAKVVISAAKRHEANPRIKLVLSEAPPPSGNPLPSEINTKMVLFFGEKDNWGGMSTQDLMWTRKVSSQQPSIAEWFAQQSANGRPVKAILYPNSGHSFHSGKLTPVPRTLTGIGTIIGNLGANAEDRIQYEKDIKRVVSEIIKLD